MTLAKIGKEVFFNEKPATREALEQVCKRYFGAAGWEKIWQDVEKYGRVHVAFVFVDSKRKGD